MPRRTPPESITYGARDFRAWMAADMHRIRDIADALGVSVGHITALRLERCGPSPALAQRIEGLTRGAVRASSWCRDD